MFMILWRNYSTIEGLTDSSGKSKIFIIVYISTMIVNQIWHNNISLYYQ